ncbi:MAG: clostripain-related cysteine peptidase [Methanomassiliicoccales archaeon]|nr:clostripain-related cysteine peptidase [Methanomassiliicoccales archaeon]
MVGKTRIGALLLVSLLLISALGISQACTGSTDSPEATDQTRSDPTPTRFPLASPDGAEPLSMGESAGFSVTDQAKVAVPWTFMVYLDADCNLEEAGLDDFIEMSSVGTSTAMNIVVQMDRASGYSTGYGDWTTAKRFLVAQGSTPITSNALADIGEVNMGDPVTLRNFMEWAISTYPAQRYALVLWDHGGGWHGGVCSDESASGDALSMPELRSGISLALASQSAHLSVIGFDACLMGMAEVAYDLKQYSDAFAFSEETEPGQGWPYDKVLGDLKTTPSMTGMQLADVVVNRYAESYPPAGKETQSSVISAQMSALGMAVQGFANAMISDWGVSETQIKNARAQTDGFAYTYYVDLYHFAQLVKSSLGTGAIATAAQAVMDAVDSAVSNERHGAQHASVHGLSIYFPSIASDYDQTGYASSLIFTSDLTWDDFLNTYFSTSSGGAATADPFELDDSYAQASELVAGQPQIHSIDQGGADVDWVYFTLTTSENVVLMTDGVSGDTVIYLYAQSDVPTTYIFSDDDGNGRFSRLDVALAAGTYYLKVTEYGQNDEITSYSLSLIKPLTGDSYEPDDDSNHASPIALGESQTHSIGNAGADVDWVTFTLSQTTNVLIETYGPAGDTRLFLYEDTILGLYELDWDDDSGIGLFSKIVSFDLPAGTYYAAVEEFQNDDEIPSYKFNLTSFSIDDQFEPDGGYQQSTELTPGQAQSHSIGEQGDDVDWLCFTTYSSGRAYIETQGDTGDTQMWLYTSAGTPSSHLLFDDDSGDGYFSLIDADQLIAGKYYVKIGAYHGVWGAEVIPEYQVVLFTDPSAPRVPGAINDTSSITVSWTAPASDGGFQIKNYEVYRGTSIGSMPFYRTVPGTRLVDINISAGQTYYYKVRATSDFGSSVFSSIIQTTSSGGSGSAPDPVGSISKEEHSDRIVLTWSAPNNHGSPITQYIVYRGSSPSSQTQLVTCGNCAYTDTSVTSGQTYYYSVVAVNGIGQSQASASVEAKAQSGSSGGSGTGIDNSLILMLALVGIGAAILAVVVAVVLRSRSRRRAPPTDTVAPGPVSPSTAPSGPVGPQTTSPSIAFCPHCGSPASGGGFCGNCGQRIS